MTSLKDQNQSRSKQIVGNDFFETRKTAKRQNRQQPRNRKKYNSEKNGFRYFPFRRRRRRRHRRRRCRR